jgi:hypothetical protein
MEVCVCVWWWWGGWCQWLRGADVGPIGVVNNGTTPRDFHSDLMRGAGSVRWWLLEGFAWCQGNSRHRMAWWQQNFGVFITSFRLQSQSDATSIIFLARMTRGFYRTLTKNVVLYFTLFKQPANTKEIVLCTQLHWGVCQTQAQQCVSNRKQVKQTKYSVKSILYFCN